ncbi:divergent polysaccharide deacetylase family protein [Psychromonas sp. RZ22]|uniref:divergent polysaccharide deacetylase family protein n=1 Tax=Psychromonas algarum TaxID=2555643 RepID=UPI0010678D4D|nr:divergent polysaccharide deacetylase family protein [Psychromonas sp. RZ22]TEW53544.1 divergent polysaccharide deacetylase family protein [Psychromonas sp. RZ22]
MQNIISKLIFIFAYLFACSVSHATTVGKITIIIDDIGNNRHDQAFLTLPQPITLAILPFTPFAKNIANSAYQQKREVLLHIPMQAHSHNNLLGAGALTQEMTKQTFTKTLNNALIAIPHAIGVNNHMGSQLTEEVAPMRWTMELLSQQGLFFIDSRTTAKTIAESSATTAGLPALRRHIFLDNIRTQEAMDKQFQLAIQHSKKYPYTIVIAHPYPETLQYLTDHFSLTDNTYQLVTVSQLISEKQRTALQEKRVEYQQTLLTPAEQTTTQLQ